MHSEKMTRLERRAVISLSSILGLRMMGLFMVLPMFSLYASHLSGATPFLTGVALGIYGLMQALFQLTLGTLSDRLGRKYIISIGLLIFAIGSVVAAFSHSMMGMILGRSLQGVGAIGSTTLALLADLTRENQRTKAMAISGITIGFSFSLAMVLGPLLVQWISINQLFLVAMLLGLLGIIILYTFVPTPHTIRWHRDTEPELKSFFKLLKMPTLAQLNIGILILHALFTASFIVIPLTLAHTLGLASNHQWMLYLPALLIAFLITVLGIGYSERKQQVKPIFIASIFLLFLAEIIFWMAPPSLLMITLSLCLFFTGFSLLEAFLPSLISRVAPASRKGSALGIYSCAQFLGIFVGGLLGGWLHGQFSFSGVYLFCIILALFWLLLALVMTPPRFLVTRLLRLSSKEDFGTVTEKLKIIPGMIEVTLIAEEKIAYLKMERETPKHPDFIRLKEQLQSEQFI